MKEILRQLMEAEVRRDSFDPEFLYDHYRVVLNDIARDIEDMDVKILGRYPRKSNPRDVYSPETTPSQKIAFAYIFIEDGPLTDDWLVDEYKMSWPAAGELLAMLDKKWKHEQFDGNWEKFYDRVKDQYNLGDEKPEIEPSMALRRRMLISPLARQAYQMQMQGSN